MRACSPHNHFQSSKTVSVYGGVEVYNERSFCVKYHSQGVQTSFYESTPSASDSLGNTIPPGDIEDPGISLMLQRNAISEISPDTLGFYSNAFMVRKASGAWRPVIDLKQLNHHIDAPHFHIHTISSLLSTIEKRGLCVQNRSAGCVLSCTNTSTQQEVPVLPSKTRYISFEYFTSV